MTLEKIFKFGATPVRIAGTEQAPLFCAADVCAVLGIANSRDAVDSLDEDETASVALADTSNSTRNTITMQMVTESGLYHLIFKSRKDEAKRFRRWVTEEVLPEIRQTGAYLHGSPVDPFHAIQRMIENRDSLVGEVKRLDQQLDATRRLLNERQWGARLAARKQPRRTQPVDEFPKLLPDGTLLMF